MTRAAADGARAESLPAGRSKPARRLASLVHGLVAEVSAWRSRMRSRGVNNDRPTLDQSLGTTGSEADDGQGPCGNDPTFSVALTQAIDEALRRHLLRDDGQEDLTFALYQPSTGATRTTAILVELVEPLDGEREVHGNASFSGAYFLRAAALAAERDLGLALLHSHPKGAGWQALSRDDRAAESGHAGATQSLTDLPLVGLTLAGRDHAYSARRWSRPVTDATVGTRGPDAGRRVDWVDEQASTVRVIGERLRVSYNDRLVPVPASTQRTRRTVQSWGTRAHHDLVRLRVGIIGAGSVAQPVAESLVRTGFVHVDVLDFDVVEEHNLDRLLHATTTDLGESKAAVLAERLASHRVTPGAVVHAFEDSLVEPRGWLRALDCDVLFSCVDRPWPRFALNVAAYAHLVPVIDGGVAVDVQPSPSDPQVVRLRGAEYRAHLVGPDRKCMECLGQYDPADVATERAGLLDDPTYIAALPAEHHLRRGENVFAFSLACAAAEVLELLRAVLGPAKVFDVGASLTHWTTGKTDRDGGSCRPQCPYPNQLLGRGDAADVVVTGDHPAAAARRRATAH